MSRIEDRLLMGLGRRMGPAVDTSVQDVIVDDATREFANQQQAEAAQERLGLAKLSAAFQQGLGEKSLAQNASQFEKGLEFAKQKAESSLDFDKYRFNKNLSMLQDEAQQNRRAGDTASLIGIAGLGVEGLRNYQNKKRADEILNKYDTMIEFYGKQGTEDGKFFADWLKLLRTG